VSKFWSYCLLLSFAFILTPKTVFHHHEHEESEHSTSASFEEDCFVCSFDYSIFSAPISATLELDLQLNIPSKDEVVVAQVQRFVEFIQLRGPPSNS